MKYSGTQKGFSNHQYFRSFYYTAWRVMIFLRFYLAILLLNAVIMIEQDSSKSTDWTKCILCQETTAEPLQCPENIWRSDIEFGIIQFNELGSLPISIDIERLDEYCTNTYLAQGKMAQDMQKQVQHFETSKN